MQSKTEQIANALINKTLPKSEWTHHAHLQTGLWHVLHHDAATAMNLMRERIRAYNLCTGVANTDTTGYHETITCFYLIVIRAFTQKCPPDMDIDALAEQMIREWGVRELPLKYYSRERLFSAEARATWVLPDLAPLPNY